ncbi:hypothetical protein RO3G_15241 [Rhizopus delemar RA 99-880]|uniref:DNA repair protein rad9 n=3 Tax=Rhizopus TaxID=4842 RepID=I1CQ00_RHIO9|nr:hypothetical protein RO3G_15241 [Rhizopus delemar RA 99-880]|eukprot:EIE90530.1 hypothetical protein RO3G_15241 [Rhizopus delemar RA 99-880]
MTDLIRNCQIHITEGDENNSESRLHLTILCQNGVTKKKTIWYANGESVDALYSKDYSHYLIVDPTLIKDYLNLFHPKVIDIVFECTPEFIIIKSFWDYNTSSHIDKPVQTTFKMKVTDCIEYSVTQHIKLVFNLKEFKAIIDYMESMEAPVHAHFEEPGKTILFTYEQNNEIIAEFALMTHPDTSSTERHDSISFNEHSIASIDSSLYGERHTSPSPSVVHQRRSNQNTNRPTVNHPGRNSSVESEVVDTSADTVPYTRPATLKEGSQKVQNSSQSPQVSHGSFPFNSSVESNNSSRPIRIDDNDNINSHSNKQNFFQSE